MHEARMDSFSHLQIGRALLTTVIYTDGGNIRLKPMNTSSSFLVHFFLRREHPWHKHKPHIMRRAWKCLKCVVEKHFFFFNQTKQFLLSPSPTVISNLHSKIFYKLPFSNRWDGFEGELRLQKTCLGSHYTDEKKFVNSQGNLSMPNSRNSLTTEWELSTLRTSEMFPWYL